jgi:hypothetical protein
VIGFQIEKRLSGHEDVGRVAFARAGISAALFHYISLEEGIHCSVHLDRVSEDTMTCEYMKIDWLL